MRTYVCQCFFHIFSNKGLLFFAVYDTMYAEKKYSFADYYSGRQMSPRVCAVAIFLIAVTNKRRGLMSQGKITDKQKEILEYIHINKTGALLKLCVRMGAILAEASEKDLEKLTTYAEKIGLAFQIKDDILSEEGNPEITGKPVGNDKEMGKCTYVSYYGLDGAKKELDKIIEEAIEQLEAYGEKAEFLRQLALYIKNRNK